MSNRKNINKNKGKSIEDAVREEIEQKISLLTDDQRKAFEAIINPSGGNIMISGGAGCGKSTTISVTLAFLRNILRKTVAVLASTASASQLISGVTFHQFFKFGIDLLVDKNGKPTIHAPATIINCDYIFCDEISMLSPDCIISAFHSIQKANIKRKKKNLPPIRLIAIGDFCQTLCPMPKEQKEILNKYLGYEIKNGLSFNTKEWKLFNFKIIELTQNMRQRENDEYIYHLNQIRKGNKSHIDWFNQNCSKGYNPNAVTILPTNKLVNIENLKRLNALSGDEITYTADLHGDATQQDVEELGFDYELKLKKNCRVIIKSNPQRGATWCYLGGVESKDYIHHFCNGTTGTYKETYIDHEGREYLFIELDKQNPDDNIEYVSIYKKTFDIYDYIETEDSIQKVKSSKSISCFPIRLAYASTVHRALGSSLSAINLDPSSFDSGMLYVSLSRTRSPKQIYLMKPIKPSDCILDDDVKRFYENIHNKDCS